MSFLRTSKSKFAFRSHRLCRVLLLSSCYLAATEREGLLPRRFSYLLQEFAIGYVKAKYIRSTQVCKQALGKVCRPWTPRLLTWCAGTSLPRSSPCSVLQIQRISNVCWSLVWRSMKNRTGKKGKGCT